ncbi:MAG TPA: hypothetical protein VFB13_16595 [Reyranella sp.]|jgi:hypothetical protein|nr:hypothetical protein [Reyranella sp.]
MMFRVALPMLWVALSSSQAMAWEDPIKGEAAVYSSVCYSVQSGDLRGERLIILNSHAQHFAIYQQTGGEFGFPIWGKAEIRGNHFRFIAQNRYGSVLEFEGTITPDYVDGHFANESPGSDNTARWQRVSADSRFTPECPAHKPMEKR